jgi:hypothetical protein
MILTLTLACVLWFATSDTISINQTFMGLSGRVNAGVCVHAHVWLCACVHVGVCMYILCVCVYIAHCTACYATERMLIMESA